MAADDTDYTKFPITARDTIFEVGDNTFQVDNKFPMTDSPYGSRLASQIALPISERQNTKNYHLLGFAPLRALQAEDLNEVQERFMLNNTLTQQMWSNWNSFNNMQISKFGPGWFGTTPLYPHIWKSNIRYLDELIYSSGNEDDLIYETPKNLVSVNHTYKTETETINGENHQIGVYDIQIALNPGWYYINDTYTTQSTHDSSGFKYWYYLKETVYSEKFTVNILFNQTAALTSQPVSEWWSISIGSDIQDEVFVDPSGGEEGTPTSQICFGIILDDLNYLNGGNFQSGDSDSGADRVEIKIKPKLGCGQTDQRTPSYIGYVTFDDTPWEDLVGGGLTVGELRAKYLNGVSLDLTSMNRMNGELDSSNEDPPYEDVTFPNPTTEFI
tara:strand:+ start:1352 stop:2509 length:1158 start_codon:yes stop_codon:yes gene_type:complete